MAKMAVDLFVDPISVEELVRDLEDSGYPVDFSREQVPPESDGLSVPAYALGTVPRRLGSAQTKCAPPRDRTSNLPATGTYPRPCQTDRELIRRLAYQFYEERGCKDGHDLDDWLRAQDQVLGKMAGNPASAHEGTKSVRHQCESDDRPCAAKLPGGNYRRPTTQARSIGLPSAPVECQRFRDPRSTPSPSLRRES